MKIRFVFALVFNCVCLHDLSFGQPKRVTYRLTGVINVDTGTVSLLPVSGQEYDPNLKNNYRANIKQGSFSFNGQMAYPGSYLILIKPNYISSDFIIDPGTQTIICNVDSIRETPKIVNKSMQEFQLFSVNYIEPIAAQIEKNYNQYLTQKSTVTDRIVLDSLRIDFQKRRSMLVHKQQLFYLNYVKQNPTSYVALWQLVKDMKDGYQPIYDSICVAFSPLLKNTVTGRTVAQRLKSSKTTAIGQVFPTLTLFNNTGKSVLMSASQKSKYTLVDFWFSHCAPCLSEFPKLKELFISYKGRGFNILGISIDKKTDTDIWIKTIQEKELAWEHYLDPSGRITVRTLSINYFPSNFLLNEKGVIIRKNINPVDLSKFLSENM